MNAEKCLYEEVIVQMGMAAKFRSRPQGLDFLVRRVPLAFISILPGIHANHTEKWGVPLVMYGG